MLQPKINEEPKVKLDKFNNFKTMGQIALGVAIVLPYELIKMGASLVSDKISTLRKNTFATDRKDLKLSSEEIKNPASLKSSHDKFNNFKIMGRVALGVAIVLPYELVKMGASLVSDRISELRKKAFSPGITIKDKNKL